jgi:hypothetical protein
VRVAAQACLVNYNLLTVTTWLGVLVYYVYVLVLFIQHTHTHTIRKHWTTIGIIGPHSPPLLVRSREVLQRLKLH